MVTALSGARRGSGYHGTHAATSPRPRRKTHRAAAMQDTCPSDHSFDCVFVGYGRATSKLDAAVQEIERVPAGRIVSPAWIFLPANFVMQRLCRIPVCTRCILGMLLHGKPRVYVHSDSLRSFELRLTIFIFAAPQGYQKVDVTIYFRRHRIAGRAGGWWLQSTNSAEATTYDGEASQVGHRFITICVLLGSRDVVQCTQFLPRISEASIDSKSAATTRRRSPEILSARDTARRVTEAAVRLRRGRQTFLEREAGLERQPDPGTGFPCGVGDITGSAAAEGSTSRSRRAAAAPSTMNWRRNRPAAAWSRRARSRRISCERAPAATRALVSWKGDVTRPHRVDRTFYLEGARLRAAARPIASSDSARRRGEQVSPVFEGARPVEARLPAAAFENEVAQTIGRP